MATTTSSRATPPAVSRRTSNAAASTTPPTVSSIARGATARSAVSPRVSSSLSTPAARRASIKGTVSPPPAVNGEARESRESLAASLKQETEKKEQLLVQLQNKDQTITNLTTEHDNLTSTLNAAEARLTEFYADQNRMEEELAARIEVIEKLRTQTRELEKEKRDIQRRYNEQTSTFEAERQAFYDNEQHLKSRIQSLTQARKSPVPIPVSPSSVSVSESETEVADDEPPEPPSQPAKQDVNDPEQEPAEMTALKLELSTLSTSYNSLQSTLVLLQTQLVDLKRVNNELQEENESYNILLRERTLNGQFDVLRMGGGPSIGSASGSDAGEDEEAEAKDGESLRSRNTGRSVLDPVDELAEEQEHHELDPGLDPDFQRTQDQAQDQIREQDQEPRDSEDMSRSTRRHRKRASSSSHSASRGGESLANLPITGPGLDLAAELGRAENKDISEGRITLESDRAISASKTHKTRKSSTSDTGRKVSASEGLSADPGASGIDIDALRSEVKSLKDANRALSLYASKIIDRIISQEGFEHVLAVDYEKPSPSTAGPATATFTFPSAPNPSNVQATKKNRPQSAIFSSFSGSASPTGSSTAFSPPAERLTTFESLSSPNTAASSPVLKSADPPAAAASTRASRRSMSFDWKSFSMFGNGDKKADPNLRPLTLRAGSGPIVTSARKLDTQEDEDDRRERERLHATMKLMGIEKPATQASPVLQKSWSSPADPNGEASSSSRSSLVGTVAPGTVIAPTTVAPGTAAPSSTTSRFSFFRRSASVTATSDTSPNSSINGSPNPSTFHGPNLTQEALEQAEAESSIAALDAHERTLSAEIAKGAGGGFTEIVRRSGDRRSRKSGESGSTVWSAGMSKGDGDDD